MNQEKILHASITECQEKMAAGELDAVTLTAWCLEQIARHEEKGAKINALAEINPDALAEAEALDAERKAGKVRGELHGIPILIKDNIDTAGAMQTTAGSLALAGHYAKKDAPLVQKLRRAGCVLIGKANLTEWANFMTEGMPNGYSSRGGQVRNPYGPGNLDPGGSSSGSAAGVAAGFAIAAVGTETSGSILSPASENSLVGLKPTVGMISRSGIIPISRSQDTAGPIARTVRDAALLLQAMSEGERDASDPATLSAPSWKKELLQQRKDLRGIRFGAAYDVYFEKLTKTERKVIDEAIERIKDLGAEVVELKSISPLEKEGFDLNVMLYEFKAGLNAYLHEAQNPNGIRTLADVLAFNTQHAARTLKYGQTILEKAERTKGTLDESQYLHSRLRDLRLSREEGIDRTLQENQLDALLFPANYGAAIPAKAGYPSITVPAGYTSDTGRPLGLTFTGSAFSEPRLIQYADVFEAATSCRVPPQLAGDLT